MIVTLNGYKLNDATDASTVAWLDTIDGLGLPGARTSTGNYAGRDGGWVGAQFFGARNITLTGHIFASDVSLVESARSALQSAVTSKTVTIDITTNAGAQYTISARMLDFQAPWGPKIWQVNFKLELLAPDPILYATGSNQTISLSRSLNGGVTWPITWPVIYGAGTTPATVVNGGSVNIYPKITLNGSMTNPILTNLTTGYFMALNVTTGTSDQVVLDMANKTILLDNGSIYGDQGSGSSFWYLAPGSNSIQLSTASTGDTVTGSLAWQSGVMGI